MRDAEHAAARLAAGEHGPPGVLHPGGKNLGSAGGIFAHQDDHRARIVLRSALAHKNLLLLRVMAVAFGSSNLFSAHSPFEQSFAVEEQCRHGFQSRAHSAPVSTKI